MLYSFEMTRLGVWIFVPLFFVVVSVMIPFSGPNVMLLLGSSKRISCGLEGIGIQGVFCGSVTIVNELIPDDGVVGDVCSESFWFRKSLKL